MTALFDQLHRAYIESRVEAWGFPPQDVETWLRSPGYRRDVEAIVRAIAEAGYVIVPREPTPAMLLAATDAARGHIEPMRAEYEGGYLTADGHREGWRAMIDAACPRETSGG